MRLFCRRATGVLLMLAGIGAGCAVASGAASRVSSITITGNRVGESINRRDGMVGGYAREVRGDAMGMAQVQYRYPLMRNHTGVLNGEVFGEHMTVTAPHAVTYAHQGVGTHLSYQFWRFPLPLGVGYTYCPDDADWQTSFAIGGMF